MRLRRLVRAAARRPIWAAATAAPAAPAVAIACLGGGSQLTASVTMGAVGLSSAAVALGLRGALRAARTEAAAASQPARPPKRRSAPKQRAAEVEQWRGRLGNGWSAAAGEALRRTAESEREHPELRVRALAALCEHRAASQGDRRPARALDADIVVVSTMNLKGGTSAANAAEILAYRAAGLRVGLVHHPVRDRAMGRPVDDRIRDLVDGERVFEVGPRDTVRCDLAIVRFPAALAHLMDDRPRIDAARSVLLVNQTPFEQYGPNGGYGTAWSIGDVHRNLTAWLGPHTWYAIGPAVRDAMRAHHAAALAAVEQADDFWYETIDVAEWTPRARRVRAAGEPIRIGRHSRDHVTKFPNMARRLRAAYPTAADIEVHTLGGNEALRRLLGTVPEGWVARPFGSMSAVDFLGGVDVYVYFIDDSLVEAFGRAPLEAMAAGVPCVLPPKFAELFGDGALYCEPDGVEAQVRRLMADPDHYAERARAGLRVVHERFSPEALLRRVRGLGVAVGPAQAAATSTGDAR
ncbi:MAG TPA: glycosyltransferase [Glycomyces sp.]|nr:glycosyltransferase [Glycomyces sp.]